MPATLIKPSPSVGRSPRRLVIKQRHTVEAYALKATLGRAFDDLYAHIGATGVAPAGPPFVVYQRESEPGVRWVVDVCAPVAVPVTPTGDIEYQEMPEERIVSLMHFGPYESLGEAYSTINEFIAEHGHVASGAPREFYLSEPDVPAELIQTMVEQPIF